mgnify:CR=1 FL=1
MGQLYKLLHLITNVKIEEKIALFIFLTMTALPTLQTENHTAAMQAEAAVTVAEGAAPGAPPASSAASTSSA